MLEKNARPLSSLDTVRVSFLEEEVGPAVLQREPTALRHRSRSEPSVVALSRISASRHPEEEKREPTWMYEHAFPLESEVVKSTVSEEEKGVPFLTWSFDLSGEKRAARVFKYSCRWFVRARTS